MEYSNYARDCYRRLIISGKAYFSSKRSRINYNRIVVQLRIIAADTSYLNLLFWYIICICHLCYFIHFEILNLLLGLFFLRNFYIVIVPILVFFFGMFVFVAFVRSLCYFVILLLICLTYLHSYDLVGSNFYFSYFIWNSLYISFHIPNDFSLVWWSRSFLG